MNEQTLEALADRYRSQGFDVKVRPKREELPDFARSGGEVDLVATKDRETVLVQSKVSEGEPGVFIATDVGGEYVRSMIMEAEQLFRLEISRSAFVMAWAAFEASARDLLRRRGVHADMMPALELIRHLRQEGHVGSPDIDPLQYAINLRNTLVHGIRPEAVPPELTIFLLDLARRLAASDTGQRITSMISASATVFRGKLNQSDEMRRKAEKADTILRSVLGTSASAVSAEWELGEDARQRPVVILTLADYTGSVTTTFAPDELDNEQHMWFRLNRVWGDLLRVRSHKEIEGAIYMSGGKHG